MQCSSRTTTRRRHRARFRCSRCATSSSSRTWSCRSSSGARSRSTRSKQAMSRSTRRSFLAAQKKAKTNDPTPDDIFGVGTLGQIIQLLRLPDGTVKVLVEGKRRARIRKFVPNEEFFVVEVDELEEPNEKSVEIEALMRSVHQTFENYVKLNKRIPPEMLISVQTIDDPARLADTIVAHALAQARRQAGDPRDGVADQAAREALRADAGRDRDSAGREEDPHARQEADGEDAEGVLPQRADAGDPEGARRARRVQERDPGARREDQEQEDVEGGARQGRARSSRSSR